MAKSESKLKIRFGPCFFKQIVISSVSINMAQESFQNYELAYNITTQLEDAEVQKSAGDIEKIVASHGGTITFTKDLEKIRLSYPIKHQQYANFGYIYFQLENKEKLAEITEQLRLNGNILRFLLMKLDPQSEKDKDVVRKLAMENRRVKMARSTIRPAALQTKKEVPAVKEEELEKQIEDIIEKL